MNQYIASTQGSLSLRSRRRSRQGISALYAIVVLVLLIGFASLAVDVGQYQLAKSELNRCAEAAARYAAWNMGSGATAVRTAAAAAVADNRVLGQTLAFDSTNDVEFGIWNTSTKTFTVLPASGFSAANAVRVWARRTAAHGNPIVNSFAGVIGMRTVNASSSAIAMYTAGIDSVITVPATSNPWLAGMPNGTVANPINPHNNPDHAKVKTKSNTSNSGKGKGTSQTNEMEEPDPTGQNPVPGYNIPVTGSMVLQFDSINGGATNDINDPTRYSGDGNLSNITDNIAGAEHGKANLKAPINAVIGVFLDDSSPTSTSAPSALDFTSSASRDFTSLAPALKQPFFIGDGRRANGEAQQFVVPQGATRMYIGIMDNYEWNNNAGSYTTTIRLPGSVKLVK